MRGIRRILAFCVLTTVLPVLLLIIPLYLRHNFYADVSYTVAESDILEITDGFSTVFCSEHTVQMNRSFNAFQVSQTPEITPYRKHIRLKKSMTIPDDTLEYWGFYLLQGASVALSVCSRFEGASILVVKGERNLRTCGMLEHNHDERKPDGIFLPEAKEQVKIVFTSSEVGSQGNVTAANGSLKSPKSRYFSNGTAEHTEDVANRRKLRHARKKLMEGKISRTRRSQDHAIPTFLLDQGVKHGGNALENGTNAEDSSVSSFENDLFKCYGGSIIMAQEFAPSERCVNVSYLLNGKHMQTTQNIVETGYYYYIFYSDNDIVSNDIHAVFDIYKPLLQYENVTKSCINRTECSFTVNLLSSDRVIVEVPTINGLEYETDDADMLLSICRPRMEVYIIFPIAVLFFILTCAFM